MTIRSMQGPEGRQLAHARRDEGFTLIEVVVALTLMAIVSTAALYFFVSGTRTVTHQQRTHGAVSAANDAMERVFSYVAELSADGTPGLVVGRTDSDVTAAWTAAAGLEGIADTYPAWDRATTPAPAPGTGDDLIPLRDTVTASQTDFDVRTLVGYCYRVATNPSGPCTRVGGDTMGTPATGYVRMLRAIVVVEWQGTVETCHGGPCRYVITSLVDPNSDIKWNNTTRLQAMDDAVKVNAGETLAIDVLANDAVMQLSSNPVSIVSGGGPFRAGTNVPMGTASVDASSGKVLYTAPSDGYGEVTIVYRVDVGARNTQATVHAYITPQAAPIDVSAFVGQAIDIPVVTRGGEASRGLDITQFPSSGTLSIVNDTTLRYVATGAGVFEFRYTYKDPRNTVSLVGVGRITVTTPAPATAPDLTLPTTGKWYAAPTGTQQAIDLRTASGNPSGYRVKVVSLPTGGTLRTETNAPVSANQEVTGTLRWTPPNGAAGVYTFTYQMIGPDGVPSATTGTARLVVHPTANPVTKSVRKNTNGSVQLTGVPTNGSRTFARATNVTPACVTLNNLNAGTGLQDIRGGANGNRTCSFTYTVSVTSSGVVLTSDPATVTFTVTN